MRCAFILIAAALLSPIGFTSDIYVPDNYPTIQDAINAAVDGDSVIVRSGTYVENVDFAGKAITVKSEAGPAVTTIDGNQAGSVVTFGSGEEVDSVLDGFTVTNGKATYGGGIYCVGSSPAVVNNVISGNSASTFGGGIYCRISSVTISNNIVSGNETDCKGGGICCSGTALTPVITNNTISRNDAGLEGDGIYCWDSSPTITNNIISHNDAHDAGGGISFYSCNSGTSSIVTNNTITGNWGLGYGGGIFCDGYSIPPIITNTILWANAASLYGSNIMLTGQSSLSISHSDVEDGQSPTSCWVDPGSAVNWGVGMIDADPQFVDSANDDFHLTFNSPCKETGDNSAVSELFDFEGDARIHDGTVDMGADEFHPHLYSIGDVVPGGPISIRIIGPPPAPVTLALGSGVQDPPLSILYGDLYLLLPLLQTIPLAPIPPEGVRILDATVPGFWIPGEEKPLQALVGPLGNPNSVLTNLLCLQVQ